MMLLLSLPHDDDFHLQSVTVYSHTAAALLTNQATWCMLHVLWLRDRCSVLYSCDLTANASCQILAGPSWFSFLFFQSKNFTCFCTLSSAASITQGCTGSARSTAVTTTQSAARTAEKQLKSYLVVEWKTLAAFGQWCIFHCVQQLMFTTSAETLSIYWPFCQTGQRDETPWSWLNCKHSFSDKQWETLSSTDPEPVWRYWHFNDQ